jgi:hypothetical protein
MAKRGTTRKTTTKKKQPEGPTIRPEVVGVGLLILAGITMLGLITPNRSPIIGSWLEFLDFLIGWGQYVVWLPLFLLAVWFFKRYGAEDDDEKWEKPIGTFLFLGLLLIAFHLVEPGEGLVEPGGGGVIGMVLGELLRSTLGTAGAIILMVGFLPLIIILISGLSLRELYQIYLPVLANRPRQLKRGALSRSVSPEK